MIKRIEQSSSPVVQRALEAEYEELEETLKQANLQLAEYDQEEKFIDDYFETVKKAVEHPRKWLLNPQSKGEIEKAWSFMFQEPPTWSQIESRTPRLALPFRFLSSSEMDQRRLVEKARLESNTLRDHFKLFISLYG